jgi:transposase
MADESREEIILNEIQKIKSSKQTVRTYFENKDVPFSREQYYRYCKILKKYGEEGLRDKRIDGNRTILTDRIKDYIIYTVSENRSITSSQLQNKILAQFNVKISESSLNNLRASLSLTRISEPIERTQHMNSGGGEILTTLAYYTNVINIFTSTIIERLNNVRQSQLFQQNKSNIEDHTYTR